MAPVTFEEMAALVFATEYRSLVSQAESVMGGCANARDGEDIVQEALLALYDRWQRIPSERAVDWLRRAVENGALSALHHERRMAAPPQRPTFTPGARVHGWLQER
jgi:DNA-directed RNA polymerase specialized sigma24 family protein